jgi:2-desacetyl-2-hydroxyethyl bacteriochlorophyllide A dehydrogenase
MKAVLFKKAHHMEVANLDLPGLGETDILVQVEACGICGTDLHIVEGVARSTPPVVLGHEYAGRVVEVGKGVKGITVGERVAVDPNISCGTCFYCRRGLVHLCSSLVALGVDRNGGMAEFCVVPAEQAFVLSKEIPAEVCAFVEPLSCAVHGIDRAEIRHGDMVVVLGGGPVGLMMLQLARHAGAACTVLVEPQGHKRALAEMEGATVVVDPARQDVMEQVRSLAAEGADVVLECAGSPVTAEQSLKLARRGGRVVFFGVCPIGVTIPVEPNLVYSRELTITGSYVNPHTFSRAISLLQAGTVRVDRFPVRYFPLDGVHEAFRVHREGIALKSILRPGMAARES